ncbi:hypothetical protein [Streptomyces sp. 3330]|uniref:LexA family protein n=1 Tax=Streptomyces sp. 3330 TaxID=2817755 RepID=UPI0037D9D5F9
MLRRRFTCRRPGCGGIRSGRSGRWRWRRCAWSCGVGAACWSGSGEPAAAASDRAGRGDPPRDPPVHPGPRRGLSVRELARELGLRSPASVVYHLANLEERGALVRDGRSWQSCRLTG